MASASCKARTATAGLPARIQLTPVKYSASGLRGARARTSLHAACAPAASPARRRSCARASFRCNDADMTAEPPLSPDRRRADVQKQALQMAGEHAGVEQGRRSSLTCQACAHRVSKWLVLRKAQRKPFVFIE